MWSALAVTRSQRKGLDCGADRPGLLLLDAQHPQRGVVEAFIHDIYAERYGADVRGFTPYLVAQCDDAGELAAAAGYRPAAQGPLFLERYLTAPLERSIPVAGLSRRHLVEVGHLAARRAGYGRRLIVQLGAHLAERDFQWMASTLTQGLRTIFSRLGLSMLELGEAQPMALGAEAVHWGAYYAHQPKVMAGHLHTLLQTVAQRQVRL